MSMASQMIFSMDAEHAGARLRDARRACAGTMGSGAARAGDLGTLE
jgi:hypothetical protein